MESQTGLQRSPKPQIAPSGSKPKGVNYPARIEAAHVARPIAQIADDLVIKQTILRLLFLLTVPKDLYPDPTEMNAVAAYLREKQAKYSLESLVVAFELYIAGGLDVQPDSFVKFGPMLIERVMQSYGRYSFAIVREMEQRKEEHDETFQMTKAERDLFMQRACIDAYNEYRATGKVLDFGNVKWLFLRAKKIISVTRETVDMYMAQAAEIVAKEPEGTMVSHLSKEERILYEARMVGLRKFFSMMAQMDYSMEDMFEE